MGDALHKKSPPPDEIEEDVTPAFIEETIAMLEANKLANKIARRRKGDANYLISNRAELATAIDADPNTLKHMLGGVRPDTKTRPTGRSVYVGRIRRALKLAAVTSVTVRADRAPVVRFLADLPESKFKTFEHELQRLMREMRDESA